MKPIKMLGLAALAALLAMAFVGATSAMAESTQLCSVDETTCSQENAITHVHEESVGKAKLLTSFGTTECNALFLGEVLTVRDESTLSIEGNFTYTECELLGGKCTATEENGPSVIKVLREGHETAKVTGKGLVHLVCGKTIDCSYNGTGLVGTAKGPLLSTQKNGEVTISGQSVTKETGGFICPKTSTLDITTTPLTATSIALALGYCVNTEHNTGRYVNELCTTLGTPAEHKYQYALVWGPRGDVGQQKLCYDTLSRLGLFEAYNPSGPCPEGSDVTTPFTGLYENGEITRVE